MKEKIKELQQKLAEKEEELESLRTSPSEYLKKLSKESKLPIVESVITHPDGKKEKRFWLGWNADELRSKIEELGLHERHSVSNLTLQSTIESVKQQKDLEWRKKIEQKIKRKKELAEKMKRPTQGAIIIVLEQLQHELLDEVKE